MWRDPAKVALLPLVVTVQLLPGAVALLAHALQQHTVFSWLLLLLGGVQRLVASGAIIPGCSSLPCVQLLVCVVSVLADVRC